MLRSTPFLVSLLSLLVAGTALAEVPRLLDLEPGQGSSRPGVEASWRVKVDTALVLEGAPRIHLDLPDGLEFEAELRSRDRRARRSATWVGRLEGSPGSHVILSVTEGVLSGWIHSRLGDYELHPLPGGHYAIDRVDLRGATRLRGGRRAAAEDRSAQGPEVSLHRARRRRRHRHHGALLAQRTGRGGRTSRDQVAHSADGRHHQRGVRQQPDGRSTASRVLRHHPVRIERKPLRRTLKSCC